MYVPNLISIPFVLSKIRVGQVTIMKNKWLGGDSSVNIQGKIMIIVQCTSSNRHLSINQVSYNPFCTFKDMTQTDRYPL